MDSNGSLYISEDNVGRVWKVEYTGEIDPNTLTVNQLPSMDTGERIVEASFVDSEGSAIYNQYCMACHQVDGSGVSNMQPSLLDSERLRTDDEHSIRLILQGSAWIENREYSILMPSLSSLSDQDISAVINYSKTRFASSAPSVTPEKVAELRASLSQ